MGSVMVAIVALLSLVASPLEFESDLLVRLKGRGFDKVFGKIHGDLKLKDFSHIKVGQSRGGLAIGIDTKKAMAVDDLRRQPRNGLEMQPPVVPILDAPGAYRPTKIRLKSGEWLESRVTREGKSNGIYRANLRVAYVYVALSNVDKKNKKLPDPAKMDALAIAVFDDVSKALVKHYGKK
jgi:hypothetical protein